MSNSHRIDIEPISLGQRGQLYRVHHAGAVLMQSSRNPEFDSCRLLLAKGMVGQLEVWHLGGRFPAMRIDIAKGAGLTIEDSDRCGPRFGLRRKRSQETLEDAISRSAEGSRNGANQILVGKPSQKNRPPQSRPPRELPPPA